MRIRSTKPEFWRSERIASVDWAARLVLKGLESYVDDNGVGKDDLALIVADVFPRDLSRNPTGTLQKVTEAISALSEAGLLWHYEADGSKLIYVSFWESIQRIDKPTGGRFRRPDGTMNYRESIIGAPFQEPSRNTPGALPPGTGEQGNRGTGEQGKKNSSSAEPMVRPRNVYPDPFEEFWRQYPRRVGKDKALAAWKSATKNRTTPAAITAAAARMSRDPNLPDENFIPHPTTWLNRGGWNDPPFPPRNPTNGKTPTADARVGEGLDLARRLAAEESHIRTEITE